MSLLIGGIWGSDVWYVIWDVLTRKYVCYKEKVEPEGRRPESQLVATISKYKKRKKEKKKKQKKLKIKKLKN